MVGVAEAASPAPAPEGRTWRWWSTAASADAGQVSVLALSETVLAAGIHAWIALRFGTLHLVIGAGVAPLLLLRTPRSTALGLRWSAGFARLWNGPETARSDDRRAGPGLRPPKQPLLALVTGLLLFAGLLFWVPIISTFVHLAQASALLSIRVAATAACLVRHPLATLAVIPSNWWRAVACVDSAHPPEYVPGAHLEPHAHIDPAEDVLRPLRYLRATVDPIRQTQRGTSWAWLGSVSAALIWLTIALTLILPTILYRLSIKGTALLFAPLIWIVHGIETPLASRLRDLRELAWSRLVRRYSAFVIALFAAKVYLYYAWADLAASWQRLPGVHLLDAVVVPRVFPPWQLAATFNAALVLGLFFVADRAALRRRDGEKVNEALLDAVFATATPVRSALVIYVLVCEIYIAASLVSVWGLPPLGDAWFPWSR